jgi:hypothetical protein
MGKGPPPPPGGKGPPPPPPPPGKMLGGPPPPPGGKKNAAEASKTKAIFWSKIADDAFDSDTVWANDGVDLMADFDDDDKDVLGAIFAKKEAVDKTGGAQEKKTLRILDPNREKNVGIVLQFIRLPVDTIREAVMTYDDLTVSEDAIGGLLSVCPTADDIKAVTPFVSRAAEPDVAKAMSPPVAYFMMAMAIPKFDRRLSCWLTKLQFPANLDDLTARSAKMQAAAGAIQKSASFPELLKYILAVGNALNSGTARQDAKGFKITDLTKLKELRTSDRKSTMVEYLVELIDRKKPHIHAVTEELACLHGEKMELNVLTQDIRELSSKVNICANFVKAGDAATVAVLGNFVLEAKQTIAAVEATGGAIAEAVDGVAKYLGENAATFQPTAVFKVIAEFVRDYGAALQALRERRERMAAASQRASS